MGKDKRVNMSPRHRRILAALNELGGEATTKEIAKKAGMNVNGGVAVARQLGGVHRQGQISRRQEMEENNVTDRTANIDICRALVRNLLQNSATMDWSLQGLGMLRCYLTPDIRMHIWDGSQAIPGVSTLHTHPWDFESLVVAGRVCNQRYLERSMPHATGKARRDSYMRQMIRCGEGGGLEGEPGPILLEPQIVEVVTAGYAYSQRAVEIHESRPDDGTVTIIKRSMPEDGHPDFANVYWPEGGDWVSAEPRPATRTEALRIINKAFDVMMLEDKIGEDK